MQGKEEESFGLPNQVMAVLPSDPFEQLDVARKITSIALATRLSKLEAECAELRRELAEREDLMDDLSRQVSELEVKLTDTNAKLACAEEERERLLSQNATLSNTVNKLNRDVSKLEVFKKTLMQSLQEEEENPQAVLSQSAGNPLQNFSYLSKQLKAVDTSDSPPAKTPPDQSQVSETDSLLSEDVGTSKPLEVVRGGGSDRKVTPPDSPARRHSTSVSPTRRQSISFSMTRGVFDEKSGKNKVDGKEFFRQVRTRLSYEQFGAFLANVKDLNSHKQTKEETLRKAEEIFGPDNNDLYIIFEGLINRNQH